MSEDIELDYDFLMQRAFRYLMRDVLTLVAELGDAPGEHHFYIEFMTDAKGVSVPSHLKEQYPERMTIVLQHQFEGLKVTDDGFEVVLWFKSKESHLVVPFDAVTSFADPSTQFGLRFEPQDDDNDESDDTTSSADAKDDTVQMKTDDSETSDETNAPSDGADIVSLDAFRKK